MDVVPKTLLSHLGKVSRHRTMRSDTARASKNTFMVDPVLRKRRMTSRVMRLPKAPNRNMKGGQIRQMRTEASNSGSDLSGGAE